MLTEASQTLRPSDIGDDINGSGRCQAIRPRVVVIGASQSVLHKAIAGRGVKVHCPARWRHRQAGQPRRADRGRGEYAELFEPRAHGYC
jgi:hypothetical protein